jgi:hypothetical protein
MDGCEHLRRERGVVAWPWMDPGSLGLWAYYIREIPGLQNVRLREILILEKCHVHLTLYTSLEVKHTQNRDFLFCKVITKIRGPLENPSKQYITWI